MVGEKSRWKLRKDWLLKHLDNNGTFSSTSDLNLKAFFFPFSLFSLEIGIVERWCCFVCERQWFVEIKTGLNGKNTRRKAVYGGKQILKNFWWRTKKKGKMSEDIRREQKQTIGFKWVIFNLYSYWGTTTIISLFFFPHINISVSVEQLPSIFFSSFCLRLSPLCLCFSLFY